MMSGKDARQRWREQQREQRQQDSRDAEAALQRHHHALELRRERAQRPPPVPLVTWQGISWRVVNLAQAQAHLAQIRRKANREDFDLLDQALDYPDPEDEATHAVFLVADAPVVTSHLTLQRTLPGCPQLRVDGWICGQGLETDVLAFPAPTGTVTTDDAYEPWRSCLVVEGPARIGLALLPAGQHAFTGDVHCRVLVCAHYRCRVLLTQRARIDCLISAGADLFCRMPPHIVQHVADDIDPDRSRVMVRWRQGYRFLTPTHRICEVVAPEWLHTDPCKRTRLTHDRLHQQQGPQRLLRSAEQIACVHAEFPAKLATALEQFSRFLQRTAMDRLQVGGASTFGTHAIYYEAEEIIDGAAVPCHVLVRQLEHSVPVQFRARQRMDTGELRVVLADVEDAGPPQERHASAVDDETVAAHMIRHGLMEAVALLRDRYQLGRDNQRTT